LVYINNPETIWLNHFEQEETLYVKLNEMQDTSPNGETLSHFANRALDIAMTKNISKFVLDLRQNNGGTNKLVPTLIDFMNSDPIRQIPNIYVLTDRQTFSAAGNFVAALEEFTKAQFFGTAPGGSGSQYGDNKRYVLPNSGIVFFVPTRHWTFGEKGNQPIMRDMDKIIDSTSTDYFNHVDHILDAILIY
jgi:C-terminal processing protease CtpA/Prc